MRYAAFAWLQVILLFCLLAFSNSTIVIGQDVGASVLEDLSSEITRFGGGGSSCIVDVVNTPEQVTIDYDPFLPGVTAETIKFTINNASSNACKFRLLVSPLQAAPELEYEFANTGVKFQLRPAQDQGSVSNSAAAGVYTVLIPEVSSTELVFDVVIIKDSVAAASEHRLSVEFKTEFQSNEVGLGESWITDVVLSSQPRAQVNLSGTSGSFGEVGSMNVVDFGVAEKGATRELFVQLRSNTRSKLTIESENKGVLKHKEHPKEAPPISYTASLSNEEIELSKPFHSEYDLPSTYAGRSIPFKLKLGEVEGVMAGQYSDIIVFEFSPL